MSLPTGEEQHGAHYFLVEASSDVHWGHRVALRAIVEAQKGHSFVVGAGGGAPS